MNRTELFLAIIAYTLIVQVFVDGGEDIWFAILPLFVLLFALPIFVVLDLLKNPQFE
ncbi:hypothetical protein G6M89_06810 [Natronolimnobius sp. AArcel1]|uniref:hypothetical protein n=1 Tax=Natronolimnobius sp. AArcel1 TaxID=1679093 RepID=UPI0013EDC0F6|nr:hypothetical protein [Natronolimnobius sp. AArcel1]NGM68721.1 hypothetical protein [Natronolimnobius sp. AArcel1]